jgi:hypothetical protein
MEQLAVTFDFRTHIIAGPTGEIVFMEERDERLLKPMLASLSKRGTSFVSFVSIRRLEREAGIKEKTIKNDVSALRPKLRYVCDHRILIKHHEDRDSSGYIFLAHINIKVIPPLISEPLPALDDWEQDEEDENAE